jgi:hypothetical protein
MRLQPKLECKVVATPTTMRWDGSMIRRNVGESKINPDNGFKCEVVEYKTSKVFNTYDKAIKLSKGGQELTLDLKTLQTIVEWAKVGQ